MAEYQTPRQRRTNNNSKAASTTPVEYLTPRQRRQGSSSTLSNSGRSQSAPIDNIQSSTSRNTNAQPSFNAKDFFITQPLKRVYEGLGIINRADSAVMNLSQGLAKGDVKEAGTGFIQGLTGEKTNSVTDLIPGGRKFVEDLKKKNPTLGVFTENVFETVRPTTLFGMTKVASAAKTMLEEATLNSRIVGKAATREAGQAGNVVREANPLADAIKPQAGLSEGQIVSGYQKPLSVPVEVTPVQSKKIVQYADGTLGSKPVIKNTPKKITEAPSIKGNEPFDILTAVKPIKAESVLNGVLPAPVNKVAMKSSAPKLSFKDALNSYYTKIVDTQRPIERASNLANDNTAMLASNSRNAGGTVDYILKDSLVDLEGMKIGKSLKEVVEQIPKGKEEDFWSYMAQRHNIDRAREGKNVIPNYTPEMSSQAAAAIEKANPGYKAIGDDVSNWIDTFMREWGVKAGTVDSSVYDTLRQTYKSYFPTQREFSQLEKSIPDGVRKQFIDQSTPLRKATGSERDINNPIENIMNLVSRTVKTARYNDVGKSLLQSVRSQPEKLRPLAEIIEGTIPNTDNIVTVLDNGKPVYLKINDKPLLDSLKGLPKIIDNFKAARWVTNKFKGLITQKNPIFAVRNIFRDIPTAYIYGSEKNPFAFMMNLKEAGKDIITGGESFQRYRAMGGGMSQFFSPAKAEKAAQGLTKTGGFHPLKAIENMNMVTEAAPRLAEFNTVLKKTGDVQKALNAANNVTVNFARGGNVTKSAEAFVPYLNAGVQGIDRFFRAFKNPKTALSTLAKGGIAISVPEIGLYLLNKDNPRYQEIDNRTKDTYFLIPIEGGEKFIKIPKSRELGVLFGSLFQRALGAIEGDKEAFAGFGETVATNFAPTNPIENNILAPLTINLKSNKDFAGRTIVPEGMIMDKRSKYLQYDEKTSEIAKLIGKYTAELTDGEGLSPKQIDYLVKSYTGVVGQLGLPAATKGQNPFGAVRNQFIVDPLYSNKAISAFYQNLDDLNKVATDRNILESIPSKRLTPEEKVKNQFAKTSETVSDLGKISARVLAGSSTDRDMNQLERYRIDTNKTKDTLIRDIKALQLQMMKDANAKIESNVK